MVEKKIKKNEEKEKKQMTMIENKSYDIDELNRITIVRLTQSMWYFTRRKKEIIKCIQSLNFLMVKL